MRSNMYRIGRHTLCCAVLALITLLSTPARAIESLSYLFGGSTSIYLNQVSRTKDCLNTVQPDYFSIADDGTLMLTRKPDPYFIESMHRQGVKVVPFLSNHWDRALGRKALTRSAEMANALRDMIAQYNLDGVDVDYQNLNENDKTSFTAFLKLLRNTVPKDRTVSVCAAANPGGWTTGWHAQYDYAALGKICDHIFIMTYDESYETGPAGPVASYDFVEKSIRYALRYTEPEKIMIGIPFYGRYWVQGKTSGGKALTNSDIQALTARYGTKIWHDEAKSCARATMVITESQVAQGLWGGKKLAAGTYDIWYEDERSLEKKLSLVRKYKLKGAGSWALGQEPEAIWQSYHQWLWGLSFKDTESHWAAGVIEKVKDAGLIEGKPGGYFAPNDTMTRAEACVLACKLANIQPVTGGAVAVDARGHWAEGYLAAALRLNLITGFPDGSLRPNEKVSRAEMSVLISRLLHVPGTMDFQQQVFPDVSADYWAAAEIVKLSVYGVVGGAPDGWFHPGRYLTRGEAAQIAYNAIPIPKNPSAEPLIEPR